MSEKILIVEDEKIVALDLKYKLTKLGYEVIGIKATGESAIELVKNTSPDLALLDIMLDGILDGIETARILKNDYSIPFIFLSALSDEDTIQRAKTAEPYGFILKPFEIGDLKTNIQIALYKANIEKRLFESELKYRTLFLTARDAVITHDENGIITSMNESASKMFYYTETDLINNSIKEIIPGVFIDHLASGINRFIHPGKPVLGDTIEIKAKKRSGEIFPVELSFSQWLTRDKHQFTLIIRDITSRKEQEAALLNAKENLEKQVIERTRELKSLIEQSNLAICILNKEGKIEELNKKFVSVWDNIYGKLKKDKYNIYSDPILEKYGYIKKIKKILETGGTLRTDSIFLDSEDENNENGLVLVYNFYTIKDENGSITKLVGIVEDITKNMQLEEFAEEIKQKKIMMSSFINKIEEERSRISKELHDEIGGILYTAKINLEVLKKEKGENENLERARELITKAGSELRNIIYSLHPLMLDNYGLNAAIRQLNNEMEKAGYKINCKLPGEGKRFSQNVELNIYRMIQEAYNNIKKHSDALNIQLEFYINNDMLYIVITDDGKGFCIIPEGTAEKSFGLENIRERSLMFGGNVTIDSEIDIGTRIQIELPVEVINEQV